jgi:hypothetical protein
VGHDRFANRLPKGEILVFLPMLARHQQVVRSVASRLRNNGKRVRMIMRRP